MRLAQLPGRLDLGADCLSPSRLGAVTVASRQNVHPLDGREVAERHGVMDHRAHEPMVRVDVRRLRDPR